MTFLVKREVRCDGDDGGAQCQSWEESYGTIPAVRKELKGRGWGFVDGRDLCPKCYAEFLVIPAYLNALERRRNKRASVYHVDMHELYVEVRKLRKVSLAEFKAMMYVFYQHHGMTGFSLVKAPDFEFSQGSCSREEVKRYGFDARPKWMYYMRKLSDDDMKRMR